MSRKQKILFSAVIFFLLIGVISSFLIGQAQVSFGEVILFFSGGRENLRPGHAEILKMRFYRMTLAFITGAGLSISGLTYQSALKNYLADPFMLGISAGAALFSALAIAMHVTSSLAVSAWAFTGAILAVFAVIGFSGFKKFGNYILILSGIALNSFFSSFLTVVMYVSRDMQNIFFWLMGSLNVRYPEQIVYTYLIVIAAGLYIYRRANILDIFGFNEKTVFALGIDQNLWKIKFLSAASVISAIIVSQTGIIGFIGLIAPHICRLTVGGTHRILLPFSFLIGGVMMIYCDLIARTAFAPVEFPVGIVTSLVGTPFFIFILIKSRGDRK
ncbi:MAG: iron ABC transporter permease [Candidatus Wallbacteria bacterium]